MLQLMAMVHGSAKAKAKEQILSASAMQNCGLTLSRIIKGDRIWQTDHINLFVAAS